MRHVCVCNLSYFRNKSEVLHLSNMNSMSHFSNLSNMSNAMNMRYEEYKQMQISNLRGGDAEYEARVCVCIHGTCVCVCPWHVCVCVSVAISLSVLLFSRMCSGSFRWLWQRLTATHCNTPQHSVTHCNNTATTLCSGSFQLLCTEMHVCPQMLKCTTILLHIQTHMHYATYASIDIHA